MRPVRIQLIVLLLLAVSIAGCSKEQQNPPGSPPQTNPNSLTSSTSMSLGPEPPVDLNSDQIEWTSCEGLGVGLETPTPLVNGVRPAGWPPSEDVLNAAVTDLI